VLGGIIAYAVSVLASVLLVFLTYRLNTLLTSKLDEERFLLSGNRSVAVALGSIIVSQAILLRHAVFPTMTMIRNLFAQPHTAGAILFTLANCFLFFLIIGILSFASVALASWLFSRMTSGIPEVEEIKNDNVAIAILFGLVVLAVTLIVNEGLEDLSRSIIPYTNTGVIRIR